MDKSEEVKPEFVELCVTYYGIVGRDRIILQCKPKNCSDPSWKSAIVEIQDLLKSKGLLSP